MVRDTTQRLLLLSAAAFALGLFAAMSVGFLRTLFLALLGLSAGGAAVLLERSRTATVLLGGAGYGARPAPWVRYLHLAGMVLYIVGIMIVVFAAMVRTQIIAVSVHPGVEQTFPLYIGAYLLMLGITAHHEIQRRGGVVRGWSTRIHAMAVAALAGLTMVLAVVLAIWPRIGVGDQVILQASDMPVMVLITTLAAGTHVLLAAGLPTSIDILIQLTDRRRAPEEAPAYTPPIVYAAVLAVAVGAVLSFLAAQFELFERIGRFRDDRVVYVVAVVPLALVVFFAASALAIWREGRRGLYKKRISTKLRNDLLVYGLSAAAGLLGFIGLVMAVSGRIGHLPLLGSGQDVAKDLAAITIIATTGPIGWYLHRQHQRVDAIEVRLPDFLNDLAESRRAGLTLAASLRVAAATDYGALTAEVKKMANQVGWGVSFNDALLQFSQRVNTGLVKRTTQLVVEASKTGGSISEILKAAARDAFELKTLEVERRVTMMTYLIVIYVVFFVFMVVLASLDTQFIPAVIEAQEKVEDSPIEGGLGSGGASIDAAEMRFVYFNAAMVQAIGNGIVGGVLGEGRVTAGFRHVAIMAFSAWVMFRLVLAAI